MLPAQIRARFPEFTNAPDSLLQATIDGVTPEFDPKVWGAYLQEGMYWLVAHKLTLSPFGQQARISSKVGNTTTYQQEYMRLLSVVATGVLVAH